MIQCYVLIKKNTGTMLLCGNKYVIFLNEWEVDLVHEKT